MTMGSALADFSAGRLNAKLGSWPERVFRVDFRALRERGHSDASCRARPRSVSVGKPESVHAVGGPRGDNPLVDAHRQGSSGGQLPGPR